MPKLLMTGTLCFVLLPLGACSWQPTCDYSKEPYMAAQSVPPLRAPEGLSAPDRSGALVIPPVPADAKPIPAGKTACLDRPPSYFATKTSTAAPTPGTPSSEAAAPTQEPAK